MHNVSSSSISWLLQLPSVYIVLEELRAHLLPSVRNSVFQQHLCCHIIYSLTQSFLHTYVVKGLVEYCTFSLPIRSRKMAKSFFPALVAMGYLFPVIRAHAVSKPVSLLPGEASYVVPTSFPTSVFSSYYLQPAATSEPQPALYDPVLNITYKFNLTDPKNIPTSADDPVYFPEAIGDTDGTPPETLVEIALMKINDILDNDTGLSNNCTKCIAALSVGKILAQKAPSYVPDALVSLCQATGFASNTTCKNNYAPGSWGAIWTQVLALANVSGSDGQYICSSLSSSYCPAPEAASLDTTSFFPKPKPLNATIPRKPSGKRKKVLHLSDFHLDPRYQVASEASCSSGMCCRYTNTPTSPAKFPAPLYGSYK